MAAGGYHHHLGFNVWRGRGLPPAPDGVLGLRHWTVDLPTSGDAAALRERVVAAGAAAEEREDGLLVRDPWRNAMLVTTGERVA